MIRSQRLRHIAQVATFALFVLAGAALAQEEGGGHGGGRSMLQLFETTGWVGYLMVACSIAGTTLVIEHIVNIRREKLAPSVLASDLEALINEEQYDEAREL